MSTQVIKTCPVCGKKFYQAADTHNDQVYSGWIYHENLGVRSSLKKFRKCNNYEEKIELITREFIYNGNNLEIERGEEKLECLKYYREIEKKEYEQIFSLFNEIKYKIKEYETEISNIIEEIAKIKRTYIKTRKDGDYHKYKLMKKELEYINRNY